MFNVTILGNNGPFPGAGGACSSYLVEAGDKKVLIDAGSGSMSNLMKIVKPDELDCIILSHLHWDHITDIPVLFYNLLVKSFNGTFSKIIDLYLPVSPKEQVGLFSNFKFFNLHYIDNDTKIHIGDSKFTFCRMTHIVETYAVKAEYNNKILVYTGDSTKNELLPIFAQGCDLMIADSAYLKKDYNDTLPHMCASQCAEIAKIANVKKLLLSHQNPDIDSQLYLKEAVEIFDESYLACLMQKLEV